MFDGGPGMSGASARQGYDLFSRFGRQALWNSLKHPFKYVVLDTGASLKGFTVCKIMGHKLYHVEEGNSSVACRRCRKFIKSPSKGDIAKSFSELL